MFRFAAVLGAAPREGIDCLGREAVPATSARGFGWRARGRGLRQAAPAGDPAPEVSGERGTPIEGVLWAAVLSTVIWLSIGLVAVAVLR